ncbi:MAG: transposase [Acidimicrobiaceae bacterium]|nr:transposase [Acidimicrobiaceae bacterium]
MKSIGVTNACLAGGGGRVAWGAGLFALGGFADGCGLTAALSAAVPRRGERAPAHYRGRVLTHGLLMLAGGGEACSGIEHLRAQPELFGDVASDTTLWRTVVGLGPGGAAVLLGAAASVRERLWADADRSGPLAVDIDSTLVEVRSENKAGAAPHYKRGYGFRPMICSAADGEPLWARLRPGNAAANDIAGHLEVLGAAVQMLPPADAAGRRDGDGDSLAERPLVVRIDAAGCSPELAKSLRNRNIGYAVSARKTPGVEAAIRSVLCDPSRWHDALKHPKQRRGRAQAADLTDLADLSGWPTGTRLVVRREPRRPGAQRGLYDVRGRGKRRRSKLVGHSVPWPGQGRMVGPEEPSESLIVFKSVGSAVRMSLSRCAANTTRCASTTSDVPDRASSRPTAGPSSNGCTVMCFRNAAKRACEEPSRHTCATTGWLVCKEWGASSASTTARAARSPRSTEIKKPASRITSRSALLPRWFPRC